MRCSGWLVLSLNSSFMNHSISVLRFLSAYVVAENHFLALLFIFLFNQHTSLSVHTEPREKNIKGNQKKIPTKTLKKNKTQKNTKLRWISFGACQHRLQRRGPTLLCHWDNVQRDRWTMTFHKHARHTRTHTRARRNMFTVHCARAAVDLKSILELALLRIWPSNPLSSASCPWLRGWMTATRIANNMPGVGDTGLSCYAADCVKPEYNVVRILKQRRSWRLLARKGKVCCNPLTLLLVCFFPALPASLLNPFYKLHVDDNISLSKVSKWTNRFVSQSYFQQTR